MADFSVGKAECAAHLKLRIPDVTVHNLPSVGICGCFGDGDNLALTCDLGDIDGRGQRKAHR